MFSKPRHEDYERMLEDMEVTAYQDRVYRVFSDDRYVETTTLTPDVDKYQGRVAVYEIDKVGQVSRRVY